MLIDSHCHLDFTELAADRTGVLGRANDAGVGLMLTISTLVSKFELYRAISEAHPEVLFTIGTHPHNAAQEPDMAVERLVALAAHPRCVAIGESGLDFHYDKSPRDVQARVFRTHIAAARETGLPLVIHAREADQEMIVILREEHQRGAFKAVLHCFSSGEDLARTGLELGFLISFSGMITFRNADELRRIGNLIPLDRLLVETDAPYLAPVPYRGKRNEPSYVAYTALTLAEIKGVSPETLALDTTANFLRYFGKTHGLDLPFARRGGAGAA
ncbi:MAG: TatD family hydrolase [Beijerinckiaceae bacterium]